MKLFTKQNFKKLTKKEQAELMYLQTSPSYTSSGGYMPDDCSECGACGEPILGSGWCSKCYNRLDELIEKLRSEA